MANELAKVENFAVANVDADFIASMQEEMAGLGDIPLDNVKIPSGGGIAFEVPGDDPENPDMAKEIIGVVVAHQPQNSYWKQMYNGANESPDCFSTNGKTGTDTKTGEIKNCDTCPMNQYGSAVNAQGQPTKGKACKNLHRIFILQEGALLPIVINIPPTSIKSWKDYLGKRLLLRGKKPVQVVTKVSLKKATSNDGITYSQCVFSKVADLSPEAVKGIEPIIALTKQYIENHQLPPAKPMETIPTMAVDQQAPHPADVADAQAVFEEVAPF